METELTVSSFDGTALHADCSGDGPPVILCDGIGCDGFIWKYLRPALSRQYRVIHWHYRGHGQSAVPKEPAAYRLINFRRDLAAIMDAFAVKRAALFGHSMGVQVATDFTVAYPHRVSALVAICGGFGEPLNTLHDTHLYSHVLRMLQKVVAQQPDLAQQLWQRVMRSSLAYNYAKLFEVSAALVQRQDFLPYFSHLEHMDLRAFIWTLAAAQAHTVGPRLAEIRQPTLIVAGDRDRLTPLGVSREMKHQIPHAELIVIPGGTHTAPIELPDYMLLHIERFLRDNRESNAINVKRAKPRVWPRQFRRRVAVTTRPVSVLSA